MSMLLAVSVVQVIAGTLHFHIFPLYFCGQEILSLSPLCLPKFKHARWCETNITGLALKILMSQQRNSNSNSDKNMNWKMAGGQWGTYKFFSSFASSGDLMRFRKTLRRQWWSNYYKVMETRQSDPHYFQALAKHLSSLVWQSMATPLLPVR